MEKRLAFFLELSDGGSEGGAFSGERGECVLGGGDGVFGFDVILVESGQIVGECFTTDIASIDLLVSLLRR